MASRVTLAVTTLNKVVKRHLFQSVHRSVPTTSNLCKALQHVRLFGNGADSSSSDSDVELPKRPSTSFNRFYMDKFEKIKESHPDVKAVTGLSKIAGVMWKTISKDEKKVYEDAYQKEKEEYDAFVTPRMKAKVKAKALEKRTEKAKRKIKQDSKSLGRPKMPAGGFGLFVKEKSSDVTHSLKEQQELMKNLSQTWKSMVESEKKPYRDRAAIEREQYQTDLKTWEKKMFKSGRLELLRKSTVNELTIPKAASPPKPKKKD